MGKDNKKKESKVAVAVAIREGKVKAIYNCDNSSLNDLALAISHLEIIKNK